MTHKVIMIAENRPSLELPAEIGGDGEQTAVQHPESLCAAKMVQLQVRAGSEEIGPALGQLVSGSMRPGSTGGSHDRTVGQRSAGVKRIETTAGGGGLQEGKALGSQMQKRQ